MVVMILRLKVSTSGLKPLSPVSEVFEFKGFSTYLCVESFLLTTPF